MTTTDTRQLWQNTLGELQLQMRPEDFRTWFRNTHLLAYDGDRCIVGTENPFNVEWLSSKCTSLVSRTLQSIVGNPVTVEFVVGRPEPPAPAPPPLRLSSPPPGRRPARTGRRSQPIEDDGPAISPRYTFDTFVVGSNSGLAHAASMAVAERPGQVHNPLFIYGGVGLGKTHLLHAIGHRALDRGLEVVYVSSETFMNEFIDSIKQGRMEDFRGRYRKCRVLLIDDIQFLAGKEQTQEEFFHTFNAVYQASGQIVISSDRHPRAITTLEDRLRSRFVWGLMTDIQQPDLETRTAILRRKMTESTRAGGSVAVPNDVLDFIAQKVPSNIRELEGALNRVRAYAELARSPVTVDLAGLALHEMLESAGRRAVAPDAVIRAVCRTSGLSREEIVARRRDRRVLVPRQIAMYLLREETDLSLSEVGNLFGGKDHSTVLHACAKIATEIERNDRVRSSVRSVREALAHGV